MLCKGLRELDYAGDAQEFHRRIKENEGFKFNGGETISKANYRFRDTVIKICRENNKKKVILSTHGTVLSEFLIRQFNLPNNLFFKLSYPDVYKIRYHGNSFTYLKRVFDALSTSGDDIN
jgi:broad specificity phosphatase PhoE